MLQLAVVYNKNNKQPEHRVNINLNLDSHFKYQGMTVARCSRSLVHWQRIMDLWHHDDQQQLPNQKQASLESPDERCDVQSDVVHCGRSLEGR